MTTRKRVLFIAIAIIAVLAACALGLPSLADTVKEIHGG